jgi:type I restriction enzyme R subunit
MLDKHGNEIEDRIYNQKDFDKTLVLDKRTELVAKKISDFLKQTNRYDKTIVFCDNIDHAERMRQALVNENKDIAANNPRYIVRITGDNEEGKLELDNFIFPESKFPVIATTSKLMSTGVDAQTCKLIVLDQRIQSMTEFKQIIGRGTRINEDFNKFFFTIIDFKKATELFADPYFDGDPVVIYTPKSGESPVPPDDLPIEDTNIYFDNIISDDFHFSDDNNAEDSQRVKKYYVSNVQVSVVAERVQYFDAEGKLITESLKDYTKKTLEKEFTSLGDFLTKWSDADKKKVIIDELANEGVFFEALAEEIGKDFDPFDIICHVAWDMPPLSRKERAEQVKKNNYFSKYSAKAQNVLNSLIDKYADVGVVQIEETKILTIQPFTQFGTPVEIIKIFGGKEKYAEAIKELEKVIYM